MAKRRERRADPCQTSKTRVRARLDIRTERLAHTRMYVASRQGARSASEMQSCWLDKTVDLTLRFDRRRVFLCWNWNQTCRTNSIVNCTVLIFSAISSELI